MSSDEYASMLETLIYYVRDELNRTKWKWNYIINPDAEKMKMADIILKLKASELEGFLRKEIDDKKGILIRSAYYNKRPNVDVFYEFNVRKEKNKKERMNLGFK